VAWAGAIEAASGRRVRAIDLGGGYHPDDFARLPFRDIVRFARERLTSLTAVYVEPGRALTQATMAMVTSVLDVRRQEGKLQEVVVDSCIAELPLAAVYPHRFFHLVGEQPVPVSRGPVRVLGRICMEDDVLSQGLDLPDTLRIGDRLVICDAGAYEAGLGHVHRATSRGYFAFETLSKSPHFDLLRGDRDFQSALAAAERGRDQARAAFRAADGERLLGVLQAVVD